ncbi:MAG TPA: hypothetical protein VGT41_00100 [Candidatus Babeliales bacterium]|nr:hypothetical protein [Candidatus Babeliales bacterium]
MQQKLLRSFFVINVIVISQMSCAAQTILLQKSAADIVKPAVVAAGKLTRAIAALYAVHEVVRHVSRLQRQGDLDVSVIEKLPEEEPKEDERGLCGIKVGDANSLDFLSKNHFSPRIAHTIECNQKPLSGLVEDLKKNYLWVVSHGGKLILFSHGRGAAVIQGFLTKNFETFYHSVKAIVEIDPVIVGLEDVLTDKISQMSYNVLPDQINRFLGRVASILMWLRGVKQYGLYEGPTKIVIDRNIPVLTICSKKDPASLANARMLYQQRKDARQDNAHLLVVDKGTGQEGAVQLNDGETKIRNVLHAFYDHYINRLDKNRQALVHNDYAQAGAEDFAKTRP